MSAADAADSRRPSFPSGHTEAASPGRRNHRTVRRDPVKPAVRKAGLTARTARNGGPIARAAWPLEPGSHREAPSGSLLAYAARLRSDAVVRCLTDYPVTGPLPVAPGQSPFRVKGMYYLSLLTAMRSRAEGHAALARITDPAAAQFARQRFEWNTWYDALPIVPVTAALAEQLELPCLEFAKQIALDVAINDIPRVFRMLAGVGSVAATVGRLPQFGPHYLAFGTVEIVQTARGRASGRHLRIPAYLAPVLSATISGFVTGAIQLAGGQNATTTVTGLTDDGQVEEFSCVCTHYEMSWD